MSEILLAHGSGGAETSRLIKEVFSDELGNEILDASEDAGVVTLGGNVAVSTDGFSVSPLFFPGGDIGKLAICGSANDVAMMGARPKYITCSFLIEEGFSINSLKRIVHSMGRELDHGGIKMISGDTKVIPKGGADGIFITTTAFGEVLFPLSVKNLEVGDVIIATGAIGTHGAVIYASREEMGLGGMIESDCAQLFDMIEPLLEADLSVKTMRDATRGGLAAVLNEWVIGKKFGIEIDETSLVIHERVRGICEILGFDACNLANEGMCVIAIKRENAQKALEILRLNKLGKESKIIGEVSSAHSGRVVMKNSWGARRFLDYPSGELLPRIC